VRYNRGKKGGDSGTDVKFDTDGVTRIKKGRECRGKDRVSGETIRQRKKKKMRRETYGAFRGKREGKRGGTGG